jgi:hypothetical protein
VGAGRDIVLWAVASPSAHRGAERSLEASKFPVFARGGKILASGADDGLVKLWDVSSSGTREMTALPVGFVVLAWRSRMMGKLWQLPVTVRRSSAGNYRTLKHLSSCLLSRSQRTDIPAG